MKIAKTISAIVSVLILSNNGSSQISAKKGDLLVNPSVTIGWYNYNYGLSQVSIVPPVGLNFEYQVADVFGVGLEGTYSSRKYEDIISNSFENTYDYSYKSITLRGSFHYLELLRALLPEHFSNEKLDKLDLYLTAGYGYQWINTKNTWRDANISTDLHESKYFESSYISNYAAGVRYYFSDKFGVFAEGGRNALGWIKLGATLKF